MSTDEIIKDEILNGIDDLVSAYRRDQFSEDNLWCFKRTLERQMGTLSKPLSASDQIALEFGREMQRIIRKAVK